MKTIRQMSMTVGFCITSYVAFSQTVPTGTPPAPNTNARAAAAWYRGGNTATSPNNIFGTMWNSPIYTYTNAQPASKLNGSLAYAVNGYNGNRNGFMLLGIQTAYSQNTFNVPNFGAFSLLHLNGNEGAFVQDAGYRPWMRTGVTFTDNNDLSYLGIRKVGNGTDITETVLSWSDNSGNGFPGPDDMVFRFTAGGNGNNTISNNLNDVTDLDGLHVARFTGNGEFGIGNTFGAGNPLYVRPTSLQHLSLSDMRSVYTQYTNRNTAVGSGTAETASDGLRFGINGDNNANVNGNALMYNQENRHLLFSTNNNTNFVNIGSGITLERMRITAIAAPTSLASGGYGVNNPAGLNGNLTRVAISHDPQSPVTRPLSLLHLGYNTGANSLTPTATDGWRNWMDIGMFVSNGTDNTYLGLKQETGIGGDRQDAVLNWGDNDASNPLFGPDNLRFIFTSTTTGAGNSPANSNNGLETARISPAAATTMGTNFGMMGIGDWTTATNIAAPIDAKLDIDGDLRIRTVTEASDLAQVLVIDPADQNRVHWRNVSSIGGVGNYCSQPQNPLTDNYEVPLNNFAYNFKAGNDFGRVNIGNVPCGGGFPARLYVRQEDPMPGFSFHTAITAHTYGGSLPVNGSVYGTTSIVFNARSYNHAGLYAASVDAQNNIFNSETMGVGVYGTAFQNDINVGVAGVVSDAAANINVGIYGAASGASGTNRAAFFVGIAESTSGGILSSDKMFKTNVENIKGATDVLRKLKPHTYKMDVTHFPQFNFQDRLQYGFIAQELEGVLPNLVHDSYMPSEVDSLGNEISPAVSYKSLNYNALIPITVQAVIELNERLDKATLSDQNVKTNVQNLTNSLDKVKQMRGVSYEWSSSAQNDMNLDSLQHIGFIAQEVAAIEPLLTFTDDSSLVHVNYDRVAPLLVESIKELDTKNHVLDSINNDLETRLAYLENCIRNANICTEGNRTMNTEPDNNTNNKSIELVNTNSIILQQNLPNPFAESTVINYNIPTEVAEAKLLFYDLNGRIIKELIIEERGESKLTVYGENLQSGVYTYSLIADGKLIATKKMVKK